MKKYKEFNKHNESKLKTDLIVGDVVVVDKSEIVSSLVGKEGTIISITDDYIGVDFKEKLSSHKEYYITTDLDGKLDSDTGLFFYSYSILERILLNRIFNIKNLKKTNHLRKHA